MVSLGIVKSEIVSRVVYISKIQKKWKKRLHKRIKVCVRLCGTVAIENQIVFEAITQLIEEDEKPKKKIGYIKEGQTKYGKRNRKN